MLLAGDVPKLSPQVTQSFPLFLSPNCPDEKSGTERQEIYRFAKKSLRDTINATDK